MAATAPAMAPASVTGSEQRSPTQTKAALPAAALILSCAGCAAGRSAAVAGAQHDAVEERQLERGLGQTVGVRAGHHDLRAAQAQVERIEQRHVAEQIALGGRENSLDQPVGLGAPAVVARQHGEPHQVARRHRVRVGRGVVLRRMRAQQKVVGVVGRQVIAAGVGVGVMDVERALPGQRPLEIDPLSRWPHRAPAQHGSWRRSRWRAPECAVARPARNAQAVDFAPFAAQQSRRRAQQG